MALRDDAALIQDRSSRILSLIRARSLVVFAVNDHPDTEVTIPDAIKAQWLAKIVALQNEIKAVVGTW